MPHPRPKPPAGGIKATFPGFIEPALATSIGKVPNGERWVHEIKFDGYRVQVHLRDAAVRVFTRRGNDWTKRFRKVAADAYLINAGSAILDGEVVAPGHDLRLECQHGLHRGGQVAQCRQVCGFDVVGQVAAHLRERADTGPIRGD